MPDRILNDDWSDYDLKKKKFVDRFFFSCEEDWEVDYLVKMVKKHFPGKGDSSIRAAIASCCWQIPAPRLRDAFVRCVVRKL
jgi:hypothetical protein